MRPRGVRNADIVKLCVSLTNINCMESITEHQTNHIISPSSLSFSFFPSFCPIPSSRWMLMPLIAETTIRRIDVEAKRDKRKMSVSVFSLFVLFQPAYWRISFRAKFQNAWTWMMLDRTELRFLAQTFGSRLRYCSSVVFRQNESRSNSWNWREGTKRNVKRDRERVREEEEEEMARELEINTNSNLHKIFIGEDCVFGLNADVDVTAPFFKWIRVCSTPHIYKKNGRNERM